MTRYRFILVLVVLAVMAITLRSVLHETHMDDQYGMARIRLAGQTVYVKSRRCNVGCAPGIWLSRSSDRCKAPDPANDYRLNSEQILYARQGNALTLVANPHAVTHPTTGDWLDLNFLPPAGQATDNTPLRAIIFGEHLPERNVPSEQVARDSCVRAFGLNWNWP